jgi:hypothetical protein
MDRFQAAAAVKAATSSNFVTLVDGRRCKVIAGDEDRGCLWVLPDGGSHDIRVWASQISQTA